MTDTVLSSAAREVAIGFERPFVIIGERINPTGRTKLAAEMAAGDFSTVTADALAQVEAGARMLDVNAGIPLADEPALARRVGVPFRGGGALTASKVPDAQAAYESANTMQPTILAGVNFVLHAAGWLEGGLAFGYEKFVMDVDQCGMWHAFAKGVDMTPNGQALDAILENGPGQHFLGAAHTLANFETAFYRSSVADNNSFEQWEAEGAKDADVRAEAVWKRMLAEYEPPSIDDAKDEELREWIERKKASFPDSNV
jgi:trimethylamine--corrinoid protein Co-methyltransferase